MPDQGKLSDFTPYGLAAACMLLLGATAGFYFGWIDDLHFLNITKGLFSGRAYQATDQFLGLSPLFILAYRYFPEIPWYGSFLTLCGGLACGNLFWWMRTQQSLKLFSGIWMLTALFFLLLAEHLVLLNFTRISVLLLGSSLMCLLQWSARPRSVHPVLPVIWSLGTLLGLLIRYETAFLPLLMMFAYGCLLLMNHPQAFYRMLLRSMIVLLPSMLLLFACIDAAPDEDNQKHFETRPYVFQLLDIHGYAPLRSLPNPEDRIRTLALTSWYFHDPDQITPAFLEKTLQLNPVNKGLRGMWDKLRYEWIKIAERKEAGNAGLYQHQKLLALLTLSLLLMLIPLGLSWQSLNAGHLKVIGFHLMVLGFLLASAILLKFEDRAFVPTLGFLVWINLGYWFRFFSRRNPKIVRYSLWILLMAGMGRWLSLIDIGHEKKQELQLKSAFVKELGQQFHGQFLFFDLWTMTLLDERPFHETRLPGGNTYSVYGDMHYQETRSHRKYLEHQLGPFDSFIGFYDRVAPRKDIVFVMVDFRKDILNRYFDLLYHKTYRFHPLPGRHQVNNIQHSFTWTPLHFGYYRLMENP